MKFYVRSVAGLCEFAGKDPDELVRLSPREVSRLVQDYVDSLAEKGYGMGFIGGWIWKS